MIERGPGKAFAQAPGKDLARIASGSKSPASMDGFSTTFPWRPSAKILAIFPSTCPATTWCSTLAAIGVALDGRGGTDPDQPSGLQWRRKLPKRRKDGVLVVDDYGIVHRDRRHLEPREEDFGTSPSLRSWYPDPGLLDEFSRAFSRPMSWSSPIFTPPMSPHPGSFGRKCRGWIASPWPAGCPLRPLGGRPAGIPEKHHQSRGSADHLRRRNHHQRGSRLPRTLKESFMKAIALSVLIALPLVSQVSASAQAPRPVWFPSKNYRAEVPLPNAGKAYPSCGSGGLRQRSRGRGA